MLELVDQAQRRCRIATPGVFCESLVWLQIGGRSRGRTLCRNVILGGIGILDFGQRGATSQFVAGAAPAGR